MPRRPKRGIDFSGWDVDIFENDTKIDELLDAQGWIGFSIYFYLCQRAYASDGYFYRWSYANAATTARRMGGGIGSETVKQTVAACLQIGLFDKRLFDLGGVLTSKGIQRRYADAIQKRTCKTVNRELWLLDDEESRGFGIVLENSDILPENADILPGNADSLPGNDPNSKVEESRVKESKEKKSKKASSPSGLDYPALIAERGFSPAVSSVLEEFVRYKKTEKKFSYQEIGFKNLLDKVQENVQRHGDEAVMGLIKNTMANGWQGIFWNRIGEAGRNGQAHDRIANRVTEVDNWLR